MTDAVLRMYTIYHRPEDHPDVEYLVRGFRIRAGNVEPGDVIGVAMDLPEARSLVPPNADARIPRAESDDPVIVETWV